jgi:hypothetical protein
MAMDRTTWLSALGSQRLRLLDCLGGNNPRLPGYFDRPAEQDVLSAFRRYVVRLSEQWAAEADPLTVSLLAAARLLTGDLAAADVVLDHLPEQPAKLDHGAGYCLVAPLFALSTALPLPSEVADTSRWLAGTPEQAAIRAWLADHQHQLQWVEADATYRLP